MQNVLRVIVALVLASVPLACGSSSSAPASADDEGALAGRTFLVKVPAGYDGSHPVPLVVAIHGYGNDAGGFEPYFGLDAVADEQGFLVVYPDGTIDASGRRFFSATDACCDFFGSGVDDVAFIKALLDHMAAKYNVDPNRIYAVGHSNGGFMSYRLACDLSSRFAAVVSLEGAMWNDVSRCRPSEPVSILEVHGTSDDVVSPSGGDSLDGNANRTYPSLEQTLDDWKGFDHCADTSTPGSDPGPIESDPTQGTVVTVWSGAQADVELWMVQGGVHSPKLTPQWPEAIYAFLSAHPKGAARRL